MRLVRLARSGALIDAVLLLVFFSLAYVFMSRQGYIGETSSRPARSVDDHRAAQEGPLMTDQSHIHATPPKDAQPVEVLNHSKTPTEKLIDPRLVRIPDVRPEECRTRTYAHTDTKVSVVIDFFDYQFYDLKITLGSLLLHTEMDMVSEIVVLDDGTSLDYIVEESKEFTKNIDKVRLIRNEDRRGTIQARLKAIKLARSAIVVYLDTNVVCSHGWLPPLLALVKREQSVIAVPHLDNINDPVTYEYRATSNNLVASFSWSMNMRMSAAVQEKDAPIGHVNSPLLRGNVFAVHKSVFEEVGEYDDYVTDNVAANMDLSFRAWMCGCPIKSVTCSRVGVLNLNDVLRINSKQAVRSVAELHFGEKKGLVYKNTNTPAELGDTETYHHLKRMRSLREKNCQDFGWYLREVGQYVATPSANAVKFGLLKCKTGRCAHVAEDQRVELGKCEPEEFSSFSSTMIFELTSDGHLLADGKCLSTTKTAYIMAVECIPGDSHQQWKYKSDHTLVNKWSSFCAMHVSDPDKNVPKKRQIVMAQNCKADNSDNKQFSSFEFIPI